ncbi:MAG: phosphatidate cytidylyltransferase [Flavobacterium sp.]|uniref:phosphatidate cytidylyltransferase n=1 Tax=Flavobacterium sp. TaxID=239 RepID=UPI001205696F|nr:phosphatidate cytidylyltransferase [Flavobacterium sp.]RZJ65750.1 MAG: phosphatidate cytidylyltransferase [Flavobacterium sp.]
MNETLTRTLSGAVYIVILVGCALFPIPFVALFGIFLLLAVYEFCELANLDKTIPLLLALVFYSLFIVVNWTDGISMAVLLATLFVSVKLLLFLFSPRFAPLDFTSRYVCLIGYIILPFIIISKLPFIGQGFRPTVIIGIFILIWANDTFAFLVGKAIGKRKLFEAVSPKKTVEGFFGGWIFSMLFSIPVALFLAKDSWLHWLVIATIVSYFGTLGDLIESKFKRIAGVKDSGRIMPGHGGILDRLDSVIFVAPFVFLFYQIIYYVS